MSAIGIVVPPLSGGAGAFVAPEYTAELTAMAASITALNAEIVKINTALIAANAAITTLSADMTVLLNFLTAVQTPTGEFRTFDLTSVTNNALVTSALVKSGIPVPPNPGV
jgi:hypothetical protein